MKRTAIIITIFCTLFLVSCQDPAKSRVYMDEGTTLMMRYSQYEQAEEAFTKAIKYDKNNYEAYYLRGCAKINEQKYKDAILDLEKAIELKPDYADAYFNIGRTYFLLNDEEKACEYYKLADHYGRPNLEDYLRKCQ